MFVEYVGDARTIIYQNTTYRKLEHPMWKDSRKAHLSEIKVKVSINEVVDSFNQLILSHLIDKNSMASGGSTTNEDIQHFMRDLSIFKNNAKLSEKQELFEYLIDFYLTQDYSQILDKFRKTEQQNSLVYPPANKNQKRLFENSNSLSSFSGMSTQSPKNENITPSFGFIEHLLNRTFLKLNFFSEKYTPLFLGHCERVLEKKVTGQKTMAKYLNSESSKILENPVAARIIDYIDKIGESFLDGLSEIESDSKKLSKSKSLLHEYLPTNRGIRLFPSWFRTLSQESRESVINELLHNRS